MALESQSNSHSLLFPWLAPKQSRSIWRRVLIALAVVLLLHLIFFFGIAPYLEFEKSPVQKTEVVQISPQDLAKLKQKIMAERPMAPLLKQELHEEFKTKEAPKDATMIAPFNQTVPKQKIAGPQPDQPLDGGGGNRSKSQSTPARPAAKPKLNLANLGLGSKLAPLPRENTQTEQPTMPAGAQGPPGPFRPVGRDDKNIERGNENLLNAVESEYYSFFVRLEEPIIRNWYFLLRSYDGQIRSQLSDRKVRAGAELPITIEFVLDRQGNFRSIDVIESSTIPALDQATRESVQKLGALPNPPPGLFEGGQYFTRRLKFMVHVSDSMLSSRPDLYW